MPRHRNTTMNRAKKAKVGVDESPGAAVMAAPSKSLVVPGSDAIVDTSSATAAQLPRWKQHQRELQETALVGAQASKNISRRFRKAGTVFRAAQTAHDVWFSKIGKGARPSRPQDPRTKLKKLLEQQVKLLQAEVVWYEAWTQRLLAEKSHLKDTVALRDAKIRELRA